MKIENEHECKMSEFELAMRMAEQGDFDVYMAVDTSGWEDVALWEEINDLIGDPPDDD